MTGFSLENQGANSLLVYTLKADDQVDTLSAGMMSNNKIPGLVPFSFSQLDDNRYFKYNITSKTTLQKYFSEMVNKKKLLGVFTSIASVVIAAEEYMIEVDKFMFDPEYIFVNVSNAQASMVCLPVMKKETEPVDIGKFFKEIMYSIKFDETENCDYVAKILSFLNSNTAFSLQEFKKTLDNQSIPATKPKVGQVRQSVPPLTQQHIPIQQPNQQSSPPVIPQSQPQTPNIAVQPASPKASNSRAAASSPNLGYEIPGSPKGVSSVESSLGKDQQKTKKGGIFSSIFGGKQKQSGKAEDNKKVTHNKLPKKNKKISKKEVQESNSQTVPPLNSVSNNVPPKASEFVQVSNQQPSGTTTILVQDGAGETILLDDYMGQTTPYLLRNSSSEKAFINKPVFRVGKEPSYVDYCIAGNPSVSRSHADILTINGEYYIRDNNSTNGTFINGVRILSNKEEQIKHEDKIILANELFEFRIC